jgi:hypothetical protein
MKIQLSKSVIIRDWGYSAYGYWYRLIDYPLREPAPPGMGYKEETYVTVELHQIQTDPNRPPGIDNYHHLWIPKFTKHSPLAKIDVPCFQIDQEESAKVWVDEMIRRVAKLSAFT